VVVTCQSGGTCRPVRRRQPTAAVRRHVTCHAAGPCAVHVRVHVRRHARRQAGRERPPGTRPGPVAGPQRGVAHVPAAVPTGIPAGTARRPVAAAAAWLLSPYDAAWEAVSLTDTAPEPRFHWPLHRHLATRDAEEHAVGLLPPLLPRLSRVRRCQPGERDARTDAVRHGSPIGPSRGQSRPPTLSTRSRPRLVHRASATLDTATETVAHRTRA